MLQWFLKGRLHKINVTTFFDLVLDFLREGNVSDLIYLDFITEVYIVTPNKWWLKLAKEVVNLRSVANIKKRKEKKKINS